MNLKVNFKIVVFQQEGAIYIKNIIIQLYLLINLVLIIIAIIIYK